jgi:hypothetical protein
MTPKRLSGQVPWTKVLLTCGAVVFLGWLVFGPSARKDWPIIPGWDDLIFCSYVQSFDGTKQLSFSENQFVRFYDNGSSPDRTKGQKDVTIDGTWSFDETSN